MASKALPLMAFLLIAMLLVSAVVDATETLDTETGSVAAFRTPAGEAAVAATRTRAAAAAATRTRGGRRRRRLPVPGGGGGGGGYPPWWRCRYRCCNRFRYNCWCCSRKEYMAAAEKHN
ncbi:unnamed protein product [Spirodela intermedia]|uniref:Uncharacterized protein n=1 Tax=Spirodela intermedia TaxID=51605 RepID=A0A7I8JHF0_SPIIN|nr:unnamed protein product [Spirodela intermedia]CAA6669589.1 unnamed protein product [Spirodela intermedia]